MVKYLDLLKVKTYETREEINKLKGKLKNIELETIKEYFTIGKKAIYRDRDGYIEGEIVEVDGLYVTIDVECVNGSRDKYLQGFKIVLADKLNLA